MIILTAAALAAAQPAPAPQAPVAHPAGHAGHAGHRGNHADHAGHGAGQTRQGQGCACCEGNCTCCGEGRRPAQPNAGHQGH